MVGNEINKINKSTNYFLRTSIKKNSVNLVISTQKSCINLILNLRASISYWNINSLIQGLSIYCF